MCQSFAKPSIAEYWQSGGITTRFGIVTLRMVSGENSKEPMGVSDQARVWRSVIQLGAHVQTAQRRSRHPARAIAKALLSA